MSGQDFTFKQFVVKQDKCAMKVGTDGVLLGAWAKGGCRILDIGTGTGLIALMMAQRFPAAHIVAVDIDANAVEQAKQNVASSPFADRIDVFQQQIQQFESDCRFDSIVSNPPFFVNSLKAPDAIRSMARHTDTLSFKDLFAAVNRLLSDDGVFSVIVPTECVKDFVVQAYMTGMRQVSQVAVRTTPRKQAKRQLLAFCRSSNMLALERQDVCIMSADGNKSEWYGTLTSDFYIR